MREKNEPLIEFDFTLFRMERDRIKEFAKRMAKRGSGNISPLLFYHGPIIVRAKKMAANFYECNESDGERGETLKPYLDFRNGTTF